jgi:hypothetical protein
MQCRTGSNRGLRLERSLRITRSDATLVHLRESMTNQLSHVNLFPDLSKVMLRRVFKTDQGVLVQILLRVCFYLARGFADFRRPGPRPKFPERWLLFRLVV